MFWRIKPKVNGIIMGLKGGLLKADNETEIKILPVKPYCKKPVVCSTDNGGKLKSGQP